MEKSPIKTQRTYLAVGTTAVWFAVVFQLYLLILNRTVPVQEAIIRYFSYYTILTNMLIAVCFTALLMKPQSRWGRFFSSPKTLTAIAVYITVVGIVYNMVLRFTWNPQGLQRVVDELLHLIIPLLFIVYWLIFAPKAGLQWKNVFPWLLYPLVYIVCILFRGSCSGFYPYPFIDVKTLGYSKVLLNCGGLFIAFLLLSLLFVAIAKLKSRNPR